MWMGWSGWSIDRRIDRPGDVSHRANRLWPVAPSDVRQQDLEALKQSHPHLMYRDFQSQSDAARSPCAPICRPSTMCGCAAPSPMPSIARPSSRRSGAEAYRARQSPAGLVEWALPIDQLGAGAKYYRV